MRTLFTLALTVAEYFLWRWWVTSAWPWMDARWDMGWFTAERMQGWVWGIFILCAIQQVWRAIKRDAEAA